MFIHSESDQPRVLTAEEEADVRARHAKGTGDTSPFEIDCLIKTLDERIDALEDDLEHMICRYQESDGCC